MKAAGFKYKSFVVRQNQSKQLKKIRVIFFRELRDLLNRDKPELFFFDWTSFSADNFKRKGWSPSTKRSIVNTQYAYSCLHMLAVMCSRKVCAIQFIRENLNTEIIFSFLQEAFTKISRSQEYNNTNNIIILDNSPLNHNLALYNFAHSNKCSIIFTAPNSSFLNAIEMLFAKCKAPLKKVICLNK